MGFEEIYDKYVDVVYSYLKFRIRDTYLIEDILQDTFLVVYKDINILEKQSSIKSWILTIAHNKMVDKLRKTKNEVSNEIDDSLLSVESNENHNKILLEELLKKLDDTSRLIIYSIYIEGLSYGELSDILNIPEGTVKSKCYYARKKLKKFLSKGEVL